MLSSGRPPDKRRFHNCVISWPGEGTTWGGEGGKSGGEGRALEGTEEEGSVVNVQCLHGPLLWGTKLEMLRKEEFIRSKDLSMREGMSSDVSPFVSIFGRILILMVPELNCFCFRR